MNKHPFLLCSLLLFFIASTNQHCIHDQISQATQNLYYDDVEEHASRNLQAISRQGIRIFYDFGYLQGIKDLQKIDAVKRMMNIAASYFKQTIKVTPATSLKYPSTEAKCSLLQVPTKYFLNSVEADLGVFVGGQPSSLEQYIAYSAICVQSKETERPLWGMMMWNGQNVDIDQFGFQQTVYVAIHQLTHILGFSAELFSKFPNGNPLVNTTKGYFLSSSKINSQISSHFKCNSNQGLPLQDQDSTLISSHWEQKVLRNQFMTAEMKKGAFTSRFTLAFLDSIGWYDIDYGYAEPTYWGKNKDCSFLDIDNCLGDQFCSRFLIAPDWEHTGYGICDAIKFSGACRSINYYSNTICINEDVYFKTNPNRATYMQTFQNPGDYSRAYESNLHNSSMSEPFIPIRCYKTICGYSRKNIYIELKITNETLDQTFIRVCKYPGQIIESPTLAASGTLKCPMDIGRICQSSRTCPYHCNNNGICIDGQCLCNGNTVLTSTCLDLVLMPISATTNSKAESKKWKKLDYITKSTKKQKQLGSQKNNNTGGVKKNDAVQLVIASRKSIDVPCISGTFLQPTFGMCISCQQQFGCQYCSPQGCMICDDGSPSISGSCLYLDQL